MVGSSFLILPYLVFQVCIDACKIILLHLIVPLALLEGLILALMLVNNRRLNEEVRNVGAL